MSPGIPEIPENQLKVRLTRMIQARNGVTYPRWSIIWCEMIPDNFGQLQLRIIASEHDGPVLCDDDWTVVIPDCIESG